MDNLYSIIVSKEEVRKYSGMAPLVFRFGVFWCRYAPRGKGAVPRALNRIHTSPKRFFVRTDNGSKLACWPGAIDTYTDIVARGGVYEPFILDVIGKVLKPGQSFYDIGGNVGMMAIETCQMFNDEVDIYCFEPQLELARHIAISASLNHFKSITVYNCLLDESEGERNLHVPAHSIHASMVARSSSVRVEKRAAYRLDDLVSEHGLRPPDLIKIDVEGAELRVFKGAKDVLNRYKPTIIFEADSNVLRFDYKAKDLINLLYECGNYHFSLIEGDGSASRLTEITDFDNLPAKMNVLAHAIPQ